MSLLTTADGMEGCRQDSLIDLGVSQNQPGADIFSNVERQHTLQLECIELSGSFIVGNAHATCFESPDIFTVGDDHVLA